MNEHENNSSKEKFITNRILYICIMLRKHKNFTYMEPFI